MADPRLYLDWNAGAPMLPAVQDRLSADIGRIGNASSVHAEGRAARANVEEARRSVAALIGADPQNVTFTSGGTEANVTVLAPNWTFEERPFFFDRLLVSAVEHPSVARGGRFPFDKITCIPVNRDGLLDCARLKEILAEAAGARVLVSVMAANNETGVIQPIAEIAAIVHAAGGLLHVDAVQAFGKIAFSLAESGANIVTLSAHKIGGPQGAGAIVRAARRFAFPPLVTGGGQENWARAGTENVLAITGFGVAARHAAAAIVDADARNALARRTHAMEAHVKDRAPDAVIFGQAAPRLPNTLAFAVPGLAAETALIAFDLAGIALSSGSACASGKVAPSATLTAMGFPPEIVKAALRVSIGPATTDRDIARFQDAFDRILRKNRERAGNFAA